MRRSLLCTAVGISFAFFGSIQIRAHHSFSSEFNANKVVMLTGTISELSWTNPHVAIKIAVKDAGRSELWTVHGDSPVTLERNGWNRRALAMGQQLTVCGYQASGGRHEMSGELVALASGASAMFATTNVKTCLRMPDQTAQTRRQSESTRNPIGAMGNPVGAMTNPILPMGNPIGPAGNPVGPIISSTGR